MLSHEKNIYVDEALEQLLSVCCASTKIDEDAELKDFLPGDNIITVSDSTLYEQSEFYRYFVVIRCEIQKRISEKEEGNLEKNSYYNEEFFEIILKKYITYLPLWSGLTINDSEKVTRVSNAPVENWFSMVKNTITNTNNLQRCSRSVRLIRKRVLSYYKEIMLSIPKKICTSRTKKYDTTSTQNNTNELEYCEEWNKKRKQSSQSNFDKGHLSRISNNIQKKKDVVNLNKELSGKSLKEKCDLFILRMKLSQESRKDIEINTRGQRMKQLWFDERKKHLTASNFGDVCKLKKEEAKVNFVKKLLYSKPLDLPAIKHGIQYETAAINAYKNERPVSKVTMCGLLIDEQYPFLACSPDGLVNIEGVLEVKCPFSTKNRSPLEAQFLDENGNLLKNHKYFFQIQGILHISKREWCDLVIWTYNGVHISSINRDDNFWNNHMVAKLENFYMEYLLPEIVEPLHPEKKILKRN